MEDLHPNIRITISALLTMPVFVAVGERIFFKLKYIKANLRSSASRETLRLLTSPSVENEHRSKPLFFRIGEDACRRRSKTNQLSFTSYVSAHIPQISLHIFIEFI